MIEFKNISKSYKNKIVLEQVNLTINTGELVCIIGESGCGKTTLLKMINKLISPSSGDILIDGKNISHIKDVELRRGIGYVIQQTGLFPHLTVKENIEVIPKILKWDKNLISAHTLELLKMVGLDNEEFLRRYPSELSGGQQQRIGVARAFACNPDIILMDEPFSALDPMSKSDLQDELILLQQNLHKTIVFVTHDMDEAIKIADKICIMYKGNVLQYDTPENILKAPINEYVENFVGRNRIWDSPEYIKVKDIMIENPITAYASLSILRCIDKMRQKKVDSLLIIERKTNKFLGILKANRIQNMNKNDNAYNHMDTNVITLNPNDTILDALEIVKNKNMSTVPVVKDGLLVGLITRTSIVTTMSEQYIDYKEE